MRQFLGILLAGLVIVTAFSSIASAGETSVSKSRTGIAPEKQPEAPLSGNQTAFAPDGFARDVMNLMTGIRHPLDESTSLTIQAGKSLKIGVTF
ncbi:MAG TPA: hypothetical protein VLJ37_02000 [bacterium]|nr:hypothetical protein [bacterium]